jgi:hypothetical protein
VIAAVINSITIGDRTQNCGSLYSSCAPSLLNKRPLSKKARIAITRLRLGHYSCF